MSNSNCKPLISRAAHKHETEANWQKATDFVPYKSEIIIYDPDENYDYPRLKVGDGVSNVNNLPFVTSNSGGAGGSSIQIITWEAGD